MSRLLQDFYTGATQIRPWMLLCSVLLAGAMVLALETALAHGLLWRLPVGWVLATPEDDWSHATWQVRRLESDADDSPLVIFFGGSAVREAISGNAPMSAALSARAGHPVRFVNLGTRDQNLAEQLLLADQLPRVRSGLVVFFMHPMFLRDGPRSWALAADGVRFPFISPALKQALAGIAPQMSRGSGWHVMRFRPQLGNWIKRRSAQRTLFHPLTYIEHIYENRTPIPARELEEKMRGSGGLLKAFTTHRDANLELLTHAVLRVKSLGYRALVVNMPRNPVSDRRLFKEILPQYTAAVSGLAQRLDTAHLDMHAEVVFNPQDFFDHVHLTPASRPRFEAELIERLVLLDAIP